MSGTNARKPMPRGLIAAIVLSALANASVRPTREGNEDDGEIDIFKVLGIQKCDDPTCEACHPKTADAATVGAPGATVQSSDLPPLYSASARREVNLQSSDTGRVRRVKELAAQLITEVEGETDQTAYGGRRAANQRVAIQHISTAALWAERAVAG